VRSEGEREGTISEGRRQTKRFFGKKIKGGRIKKNGRILKTGLRHLGGERPTKAAGGEHPTACAGQKEKGKLNSQRGIREEPEKKRTSWV